MQTYNYMISKGNLVFSFFTNYDQWIFLKRQTREGLQILQTTRSYDRTSARLALAAFIVTVVESPVDALTLGVVGMPGVIPPPPPHHPDEDRHGEEGGGAGHGNGSSSSSVLVVGAEVVPGVRFTTTKDALDIASLSVHEKWHSVLLHVSEKACTFRYRPPSQDLDLVWRQFDTYGLPKHSPDYSVSVLREMLTREIQVYMHLRDHWGTLVPRFVYCGLDFFVLWVFVTEYEGVDLRTLAKQRGGLSQEVKDKAKESLKRLHTLGVVHGDVALRNILFREKDAKVLWIDFEHSSIGGERFTERTEDEFQLLETVLGGVETEETAPTLPLSTGPLGSFSKRTKIHCFPICPCGSPPPS